MKKKVFILLLVAVIIALGFLRDYIFVSINRSIESGNDIGGKLSILKWILTFVFSMVYLGFTCWLLYAVFQTKKYFWLAITVYSALFLIAFISAGAGYFFSSFKSVYPFVRTVMGITQSPVLMMVLIPSCLWNEFFKN